MLEADLEEMCGVVTKAFDQADMGGGEISKLTNDTSSSPIIFLRLLGARSGDVKATGPELQS